VRINPYSQNITPENETKQTTDININYLMYLSNPVTKIPAYNDLFFNTQNAQ
jgi:hypothetical protein